MGLRLIKGLLNGKGMCLLRGLTDQTMVSECFAKTSAEWNGISVIMLVTLSA